MRSGFQQLAESGKEFWLDVHAIAGNFLGEHNWDWIHENPTPPEGQYITPTRWERFKEEMMRGIQFYSNDSVCGDRAILGISASLYSLLYIPGRLVYDGLLNTFEYGSYRITGQAYSPWHPEGRKKNGYILGVPVAAPLVASLGLIEAAGRSIGLSQYGAEVLYAGHHLSMTLAKRYSYFSQYIDEPIPPVKSIFSCPNNITDALDRGALITLPAAIALTETGLTIVWTASETLLGVTEYGSHVVGAATGRMRNMSCYTRKLFGEAKAEDIARDQAAIFTCPVNARDMIDRLGIVTGAGAVALTEIGLGVSITVLGAVGEVLGRIAGLTHYGSTIVQAGHHISLKIAKRYVGKCITEDAKEIVHPAKYDERTPLVIRSYQGGDIDIEDEELGIRDDVVVAEPAPAYEDLIFSCPTDFRETLDHVALITFPTAIALTEMGIALGLTITMGAGEIMARAMGFSSYGKHIVSAAAGRMRNMSSYTRRLMGECSESVIAHHEEALFTCPEDGWECLDRVGIIGAGIVASTEIVLGASISLLGGVGEFVGRILGVSRFGANIVLEGHLISMRIASRYVKSCTEEVSADESNPDEIKAIGSQPNYQSYPEVTINIPRVRFERPSNPIFTPPTNCTEIVDRFALITFPGIIFLSETALALTFTTVAGTLEILRETLGRIAGLTYYGADVILAGHHISTKILSRYICCETEPVSLGHIFSCPETIREALDRGALVTIPGAIALSEIGVALSARAILSSVEVIGRCLGISERSAYFYGCALSIIGNMYGVNSSNLDGRLRIIMAPVNSCWDGCDCIGLSVAAMASLSMAVIASIPPIIGFSKSNYHRFVHYKHHAGNMIAERNGEEVHRELEQYHKAQLKTCEQSLLGNVFSHVNVFNGAAKTLYFATRWVAAPAVYASVKVVKNLGGIVPVVSYIANNCCCPTRLDLEDPFDRIKKRFADLKNALDKYGHLPITEGSSDFKIESIESSIRTSENRSLPARFCFGLFTESRKILSLGQTPEERVIDEISDKFNEFTRMSRRYPDLRANSFFTNDISIKNGKRFSYDEMVRNIKNYYPNQTDKLRIERVATLMKAEVQALGEEETKKLAV